VDSPYAHTVSDLWTPRQLDAIERRYPTDEVRALLAEIRRLDTIAVRRRSRAIALLVSRAKALITNASRGAIDYELEKIREFRGTVDPGF
jgi:hypothetical protein